MSFKAYLLIQLLLEASRFTCRDLRRAGIRGEIPLNQFLEGIVGLASFGVFIWSFFVLDWWQPLLVMGLISPVVNAVLVVRNSPSSASLYSWVTFLAGIGVLSYQLFYSA